MRWMNGRPSRRTMAGLALFALLLLALTAGAKKPTRQRWFDDKLRAAQIGSLAQFAVKERLESLRVAIDPRNDPNATGLIGEQFTQITTDRGVLPSKLTATNPNFAAAVVDLLRRAKLRRGDRIALGLTGSMPGLNIACLAASEALGLEPIIITSVGSSMWGANRAELTWLDMETLLVEKGILHARSVAASLGGGSDNGRGLAPEGRRLLREAIARNGATLIEEDDLEASIAKRMEIFDRLDKEKPIRAYVNVGGGLASLGGTQNARLIPPGLSKNLGLKNYPVRGVINRMAERGLPVIQLLQVEELSRKYGLPETPVPMPPIGEGPLFFRDRYTVELVAVYLGVLALTVFVFIRIDVRYYLARRRTPLKKLRPPAQAA